MSAASVHVLAVGGYGRAVAARLQDELEGVVVTALPGDRSHPMTWPAARLHVVASWREAPGLTDAIDASAAAWRVPWLPVVIETSRVRIGPLVDPGHGPCHRCFEQRRRQHDHRPEVADALSAHYAAHPEEGPDGFLPAQVTLAVSGVLDAVARLADDDRRSTPTTVRTVDVLDGAVAENSVTAVHGCDRCAADRDPHRVSVGRLSADLARILPRKEPAR